LHHKYIDLVEIFGLVTQKRSFWTALARIQQQSDEYPSRREIVRAIPTRLDQGGTANIIALYPMLPGTSIRDQFNCWLDGTVDHYEVLDHTSPVPHYQDLLSEQPFAGNKSAWRFGVVSMRRHESGKGWWKEGNGNGMSFADDGSCSVVADHDAC
jgi:hypothetical protein